MATETGTRVVTEEFAFAFHRFLRSVDLEIDTSWDECTLMFDNPAAMMELAAALAVEASELQDRIDIANGDGGDQ